MRQSQVKPGVHAMLSLGGRRGSVRVIVRYQRTPERAGDVRWACERASGDEQWFVATPRQLRPVTDWPASEQQARAAEHYQFMRDHFMTGPAEPGQTIDAGDVIIETTLHRLG